MGLTQPWVHMERLSLEQKGSVTGLRQPMHLNFWFIVNCCHLYTSPEELSIRIIQFSSVQSPSRVWLLHPMNPSTPGLPVHHQLPESTQTHIHRVGDAIQPSHPLSSPSPPVPNPSQHQGLFQWVNSSNEVVKVLEFQLQHQSYVSLAFSFFKFF